MPPTAPRRRELLAFVALALLLAGLPLAVWLDVQALTASALQRQAHDVGSMISSIRAYYSNAVVSRVLAAPGSASVTHHYETVPGAIPLPATLSLELGQVIADKQDGLRYRFVSDLPFKGRAAHALDGFESNALAAMRANPARIEMMETSSAGFSSRVRMVTPVVMGAACVACHNSHPDSPKHDWKIGDVRGLQEVEISSGIGVSIWSFKYSLAYFLFIAVTGASFIVMQRRLNRALASANDFLAAVSMKISHYLSPQIYKSIFSGEMDVSLATQRKKLTIFFSDIKDFTALSESLQPEELTALINEYFTEMSGIALRHGGTIDKFIGDALLVFFGDPETKGTAEDARACLRMAVDMQHALARLNIAWRKRGVEAPFQVRMGINTGFCNVGNFGSNERMDYTILGAEANLAARLQSIAAPGGIVCSYETYALVRDMVSGHALPPTTMKGIAREVVPYAIDGLLDAKGRTVQVVAEHGEGLDLYLDLGRVTGDAARTALNKAITALDKQT